MKDYECPKYIYWMGLFLFTCGNVAASEKTALLSTAYVLLTKQGRPEENVGNQLHVCKTVRPDGEVKLLYDQPVKQELF